MSRDLRYLAIIATTLAVNILVAAVFYNLLHLDIHIYTLAGITVSLGIIIDTSIIMVDHYSYYRDRRVFVSILGALLTTIGALGIVWLLPEEQRLNLVDFSLVIVINLVVSLFVALLFVPALLEKFPLGRSMTVSSVRRRRFTVRFSRLYGRFIAWGRRRRWIFVAALLWGFGLPTFLLPDRIEEEDGKPSRGRPGGTTASWAADSSPHTARPSTRCSARRSTSSGRPPDATTTSASPRRRSSTSTPAWPKAAPCSSSTRSSATWRTTSAGSTRCRCSARTSTATTTPRSSSPSSPNTRTALSRRCSNRSLTAAAIRFGGATWRISGIDDNYFNNNVISNYRSNQIRLRGYNYDQLSDYADALVDSLSQNRRVSQPEIMTGNGWSLPHNEFNIRYDDERVAAAGLNVADYYSLLGTMLYRAPLPSVTTATRCSVSCSNRPTATASTAGTSPTRR